MKKHVDRESIVQELRFVLGHCLLVMALALYSSAEQGAAWWLAITHSVETPMVRVVKLILELTLGLVLMKHAGETLRLTIPWRLKLPSLASKGRELAAA